jgi:hypothetical protein
MLFLKLMKYNEPHDIFWLNADKIIAFCWNRNGQGSVIQLKDEELYVAETPNEIITQICPL